MAKIKPEYELVLRNGGSERFKKTLSMISGCQIEQVGEKTIYFIGDSTISEEPMGKVSRLINGFYLDEYLIRKIEGAIN